MTKMNDGNSEVHTQLGGGMIETIRVYSVHTRDHLILIRDACHALRTGAAAEIDLTVQTKDWTLTMKARR
jgi:hypothetical protein